MSLFALIVVLFLGIATIAALIYSWLIAGQRNETYGTLVVRRKTGAKRESRIARAVTGVKDMFDKLTRPIDWSKVGGGAGLIPLAEAQTQPGARR